MTYLNFSQVSSPYFSTTRDFRHVFINPYCKSKYGNMEKGTDFKKFSPTDKSHNISQISQCKSAGQSKIGSVMSYCVFYLHIHTNTGR